MDFHGSRSWTVWFVELVSFGVLVVVGTRFLFPPVWSIEMSVLFLFAVVLDIVGRGVRVEVAVEPWGLELRRWPNPFGSRRIPFREVTEVGVTDPSPWSARFPGSWRGHKSYVVNWGPVLRIEVGQRLPYYVTVDDPVAARAAIVDEWRGR